MARAAPPDAQDRARIPQPLSRSRSMAEAELLKFWQVVEQEFDRYVEEAGAEADDSAMRDKRRIREKIRKAAQSAALEDEGRRPQRGACGIEAVCIAAGTRRVGDDLRFSTARVSLRRC